MVEDATTTARDGTSPLVIPWVAAPNRSLLQHCRLKAHLHQSCVQALVGLKSRHLARIETGGRHPARQLRVLLFRYTQLCCSDAGCAELRRMAALEQPSMPAEDRMYTGMELLFSKPVPPVDYSWAHYWVLLSSRIRTGRRLAGSHFQVANFLEELPRLRALCTNPADVAALFHLPDPELPPWSGQVPEAAVSNQPIQETAREHSSNLFDLPVLRASRD